MQCSMPKATKAIVGNQRAAILPIVSVEAAAANTAKQTSQLHPIPRRSAYVKPNEHLALAKFTTAAAQGIVPPALSKISPER